MLKNSNSHGGDARNDSLLTLKEEYDPVLKKRLSPFTMKRILKKKLCMLLNEQNTPRITMLETPHDLRMDGISLRNPKLPKKGKDGMTATRKPHHSSGMDL